jgi:hypothetical protein
MASQGLTAIRLSAFEMRRQAALPVGRIIRRSGGPRSTCRFVRLSSERIRRAARWFLIDAASHLQ